MKLLILVLTLISTHLLFADCEKVMQFSATIGSVEFNSDQSQCTIKLAKFNSHSPYNSCPAALDVVWNKGLIGEGESCQRQSGDLLAGYAVEKNEIYYYQADY